MATLLMRLMGPMQSWGTTSRFDERDTQREPSKSGVIGLICAALGRDRSEPVEDLAALRMGTRVEREGILMRDYVTATGVVNAAGKVDRHRTVVSQRYFLSDAAFLVGMEGETGLLAEIVEALNRPVWPLFLGRKSYVPTAPVSLKDGMMDLSLEDALSSYKCLLTGEIPSNIRRMVIEHAREGSIRLDQPLGSFAARRFGPRFVKVFQKDMGAIHASNTPSA